MAEYKGVMVFCEVAREKLAAIAAEGLGCGRKLADSLGQPLIAVIAGSGISAMAKDAISSGADKVYVIDEPVLKDYQSDAYLAAMDKLVKQVSPRILILGQTSIGRDLSPRLAFRLGTTATLDCIDLAIDPASKNLVQTKPVYGGNAQALFTSDTFPQIATIRSKAMSPLEPNLSRQGEVIKFEAGVDPSIIKAKLANKVVAEVAGVKLEDARVVVAGGRGIGGPEGFKQLDELARLLKGAIGASRPPCDNGWVPDTVQIGLTGKIVAPELYFAVAISGSSQHMSGCSGCKSIVAINKDAEANIFREARFGVVGDWKKILPAFTAKVKELLAA
ncbi:MAG: electron transfer flavoprotein subunit alpha/FixB family protein [Dehalococcoidales bacterium]|nr:electron transfer flavoprotein subunit alpha/FixB family protein [Dehalococcoidales bacterium]